MCFFRNKGSATKEENRLKSWTDFAISLGVDSYKDLREESIKIWPLREP